MPFSPSSGPAWQNTCLLDGLDARAPPPRGRPGRAVASAPVNAENDATSAMVSVSRKCEWRHKTKSAVFSSIFGPSELDPETRSFPRLPKLKLPLL